MYTGGAGHVAAGAGDGAGDGAGCGAAGCGWLPAVVGGGAGGGGRGCCAIASDTDVAMNKKAPNASVRERAMICVQLSRA